MDNYLTKIQFRQDSQANWTNVNPILSAGEPGYEIDTNRWKLGDGVNTWNNLEYRDGVYNPNLPSQPSEPIAPSSPAEQDKLKDFTFTQETLTYEDNVATVSGSFSYTTENNDTPIEASGDIDLNIEGSENVSISTNENNLKIDLSKEFLDKFNYLDNQSQIFVEDYTKYSDFASALNEFITTSGLEILGFKMKILRDLNVSCYNWVFNKTDGTVTVPTNTIKILDGQSTLISFNFKYNDDKTSINISAIGDSDPVLIKVSTNTSDEVIITPAFTPVESDGNLKIRVLGPQPGRIADDETPNSINNTIQFSIIGLDKTGVMKKK